MGRLSKEEIIEEFTFWNEHLKLFKYLMKKYEYTQIGFLAKEICLNLKDKIIFLYKEMWSNYSEKLDIKLLRGVK